MYLLFLMNSFQGTKGNHKPAASLYPSFHKCNYVKSFCSCLGHIVEIKISHQSREEYSEEAGY